MELINFIKTKAKNIIGEKNLEFISHAKNYMSATFFTKALGFISVPVFTRLLTPDEYGILAIFSSVISIATILLGLNFKGSVVRYYHEDKNDFGQFMFSNFIFLLVFNIFSFYFINLFKKDIANLIGINVNIFIIAVITATINFPLNLYLYYLRGSKKSKRYSIISVSKSIVLLVISIIWVYLLSSNRYYGKIYAQLFITVILLLISIFYLVKIFKFKFKFKYVKYALSFGVPLIPHALSGFILSYFDRIAINQISGSLDTGLYSLAYNVGMIMNVVVMAMNKAWTPIFYDNLKENKFTEINDLAYNYAKYIYLAAISLVLFSQELVIILADQSYHKALNLVPIIIISYVFVFLYTLYGNYSFYRKRTGLISIATLSAGFINIGLNYWLIPKFGYVAAAYTTLFSYIFLFLFHYFNVKFVLKEKIISLSKWLPNLFLILIIIILYLILNQIIVSYFLLFFIKLIVFFVSIYYFIFWK